MPPASLRNACSEDTIVLWHESGPLPCPSQTRSFRARSPRPDDRRSLMLRPGSDQRCRRNACGCSSPAECRAGALSLLSKHRTPPSSDPRTLRARQQLAARPSECSRRTSMTRLPLEISLHLLTCDPHSNHVSAHPCSSSATVANERQRRCPSAAGETARRECHRREMKEYTSVSSRT